MKIKGTLINLESRPDRKKRIEKNLKKKWSALNYSIFNAVFPSTLLEYINIVFKNHEICENDIEKLEIRFKARLSCMMSHIMVINNFINSNDFCNYDAFLIIEDDCKFKQKMNPLIEKTEFPDGWDLLYFRAILLNSERYNAHWHRVFSTKSTSCYLIHRKFIKEFYNLITKNFILYLLRNNATFISDGMSNRLSKFGLSDYCLSVNNRPICPHCYTLNPPIDNTYSFTCIECNITIPILLGCELLFELGHYNKKIMNQYSFYAKVPSWTTIAKSESSIINPIETGNL